MTTSLGYTGTPANADLDALWAQARNGPIIPLSGPLGYFPLETSESSGTISSYAYPFRNVRRYGALPTASAAINTAAIQAAVTACNGAGGGTIYFPPGVYQINAAINLGTTGNITLDGKGRATLQPMTAGQRGVTAGGPMSNVLIDGLHIVGTGYSMGYIFSPITNLRIQNCTISGANANDPSAPGITAGIYCAIATNVVIDNCDFSGNGYTSGLPQTLGADILMGGNFGTGDVQQNITITRCRCKSTTALQNIGLFDVSNALIQGNDVGGAIVDASSNTRGGYGIMLYNTTSNPGANHHNRVIGNNVKNTQGTGIYLQASHRSIVTANAIQGSASAQNDSSLASGAISSASCYNTVVSGNMITDVYLTGITVSDVDGTRGGISVAGNVIDNVMAQPGSGLIRPAIYLRGLVSRTSVIGNEIVNFGTHSGIGNYDNGVAMPVSSHNRIIGNSVVGARVLAASTVASTAGAAIFTPAMPTLANGDKIVVGQVAYTISALAGGGATCTLSGAPTFAAVAFYLPKVTASNNYGILLLGAQHTIVDGNSVDNVAASCIYAADGSGGGSATSKLTVTNNTCTDGNAAGSANFGIRVLGTDCIISGNHSSAGILGQQYGGINATGAGTLVHHNNTRTNTTVNLSVGSGAIEWGNIVSTNITAFNSSAPFNFQARVVQKLLTPTEAELVASIDASAGNAAIVTLTANRLVGSLGSIPTGTIFTFTFVQDGTGGRAVTWNAQYKLTWSDVGNTAGKRSSIAVMFDGTSFNQISAQTPYV